MEDVLDVYQRKYDETCPVICMDEKPYQFLDESRALTPMKPGKVTRYDSEYIRNGTCSIFMFAELLKNWRNVSASERRTKKDWAKYVAELLEVGLLDYCKIRSLTDTARKRGVNVLFAIRSSLSSTRPAEL